jgi:hypothetical protein
MQFLPEFFEEVVTSHVLVVAGIIAGEPPRADLLRELGAEVLAVDKLSAMASRQTKTLQAARDCWCRSLQCFQACADPWSRLPDDHDGPLAGHRRLLARLVNNAEDVRILSRN